MGTNAQTVAATELPVDQRAGAWLRSALRLGQDESPFPWQERLLARLLKADNDGLPRSLDIPTGLGKTSVMAIWLVARALGADVPRRLVYIVDRRVVVDQATDTASSLQEWVSREPEVREALDLKDGRLPLSTLRGKLVDNREWVDDPASPAIVVGTVDMIGSRLLFEGYRASRKLRPYLAGLLGQDCLFVLDEAHLVPPFERLLERITLENHGLGGTGRDACFSPPPSRLLSLSATGRSRGGTPFTLDATDEAHPIVAKRTRATKRLLLEELDRKANLAEAAAERAWKLAGEGARAVRCLVYLTRRDDAERARAWLVKRAGLDKQKKGDVPRVDVELLVGGRRVFERESAARRLAALGFLAGTTAVPQRPAFLFATSAGEVGIDLDADHMVCDLVPWERMVQRLGRVNRRGEGSAEVIVLDGEGEASGEDVLFEQRTAVRTLIACLSRDGDDARDASPGALLCLQRAAAENSDLAATIERASTPEPLYPRLDRPTLDAWSMTSLESHPGRPRIGPWLRGWIEDRPQTAVAWRRHLGLVNGRAPMNRTTMRFFEAAPLHASELLDTETFRVAEWLISRAKQLASRAEKATRNAGEVALDLDAPAAVLLSEEGKGPRWWSVRDIDNLAKKELERALEGAELVVDARFGGLADGMLSPEVDAEPPVLDDEGEGSFDHVPYRVRETAAREALDEGAWIERERFPLLSDGEEVARWLVVQKHGQDAATEEDRSAGRPQGLAEHQAWAAARARDLAARMKLPADEARVICIAARLHDEGKRAARWQTAFRAPKDAVYAKTRGPINVQLLDGYRHEFGSLPHAESDAEVAALPEEQRDLVLHLIASHHGFARPVISTRGCEDEPPSALEGRAREVALRFLRLQQRYGPWGLAWREALLRAADQQASRDNDAQRRRAAEGRAE